MFFIEVGRIVKGWRSLMRPNGGAVLPHLIGGRAGPEEPRSLRLWRSRSSEREQNEGCSTRLRGIAVVDHRGFPTQLQHRKRRERFSKREPGRCVLQVGCKEPGERAWTENSRGSEVVSQHAPVHIDSIQSRIGNMEPISFRFSIVAPADPVSGMLRWIRLVLEIASPIWRMRQK
jgi:hypothetical protein